ncbi:MAG: alkaline phosphatase family protein [Bryobacteraceae bacterium]
MRKLLALLVLPIALLGQTKTAPKPAAKAGTPKLVVGIVIDQFRYDYLTRYRGQYTGAFARMLDKGADFVNAHHEHMPTVTAVGHSTFLSGATPAVSGIVGNEWYDRTLGKRVGNSEDDTVKLLGAPGKASSPRRLLVSTLGDQLKMSGKGGKVIGISLKDRGAILPSGHMADGAYWMDAISGNFVSSSYYFNALPAWVEAYNAAKPAEKFHGEKWTAIDDPKKVMRLGPAEGNRYYASLEATPWGNELIEGLAEKAIVAEKLGKGQAIDLLTVSFSANDYVGHALGPDSAEARDIAIRTDRIIEKLFQFIEKNVGMANTLVVLTADHGVSPTPEENIARKMPGGRFQMAELARTMESALTGKFGGDHWIVAQTEFAFYLNEKTIAERKLDHADVERVAAQAAWNFPHVFRVYTKDQLIHGAFPYDQIGRRVANGFYPQRSGDVIVMPEAYWIGGRAPGTTHGSPFFYDSHVPILFLGPGVKAGKYYKAAAVNDIAPTLAVMLGIEAPSGSQGRILEEMLH